MGEQLGFSMVRDNVVRRQEFAARHPQVVISHQEQPWAWSATWFNDGQRQEVTRPDLGDLLDVLLG